MSATRYLLLPKPGLYLELLDEALRGQGLRRADDGLPDSAEPAPVFSA